MVDDDEIVASITDTAAAASGGRVSADVVARTWWSHFEAACLASRGSSFERQRDLATRSLGHTLDELAIEQDPTSLTARMWPAWRSPQPYPDAQVFLARCPVPVCVLSDIDRDDIEAALAHSELPLELVITSEAVRAYKPAPEGFLAAADQLGLPLADLWHIGDSLRSDIAGAAALGLGTVWVNRRARSRWSGPVPDVEVRRLTEVLPQLLQEGGVDPASATSAGDGPASSLLGCGGCASTTTTGDMPLSWKLVIDTHDARALADFWAAALDYEVEDPSALIARLLAAGHLGPDAVTEHRGRSSFRGLAAIRHPDDPFDETSGIGHGRRLLFSDVGEAKSGKNRLHIDIHSGKVDLEELVVRLEGLGATRLRQVDQGPAGHWWVMQDPEGNEFCAS